MKGCWLLGIGDKILYFFFFFWPCLRACGILAPPAGEARVLTMGPLNHGTLNRGALKRGTTKGIPEISLT